MRGIFTPSLVRGEKSFAGSFKICLILLLSFVVVRSEGQISKRLGDVITNLDITCTAGPCTPAGTIVIDGNPCDWNLANFSTFPIRSYQQDPFGNGVVDNQFTEGSKDFFEAHDLIWSISQTKAKNDIANGAAVLIGTNLYFAGDRTSNNGDAQIGFWFYQNGTGPVIQPDGTHNFAPDHAVGDLLILADFTGGGRTATVTVYEWVGTGGNVPNTGGTLNTTNCTGIVAENNDAIFPVPTGWNFINPCYDVNEFYEGHVDLACVTGGANPNVCFSSFLLETRSSQSITASLDDFVGGAFGAKPQPPTVPPVSRCGPGSITLTANCSGPSSAVRWYTVASGGTPIVTGGIYTVSGNTLTINPFTTTTTFYASCINTITGCESDRTSVVATITAGPTVVGDVIPSEADNVPDDPDGITPLAPTADCPHDYQLNLLRANVVHLTASGATTLSWALVPDANPNDNISFVDNGNGTATFTINSGIGFSSIYKFVVTGTNGPGCDDKDTVCIVPTAVLPICNLCGPDNICAAGPDQVYCLKSACTNANPDALDLTDFDYIWTITNKVGTGTVTFVGASTNVACVTTHITGTVTSYTVQLNINNTGPLHINVPPCTKSTTVTCPTPTIGAAGQNATIECTATPNFTPPTSSDACDGSTVNIVSTTTTGTACARVITRTWDATNACGNHSATVSQSITQIDTQAPTIGQAGGNATIDCAATPNFTVPTASDACSGATVNLLSSITTGNSCSRVITRTWDATDACGNHSATRTQVITAIDTHAPTIGDAGGNATIDCTGTPNFTAPTAADDCSGATVNLLTNTTTGNSCSRVFTRTWDATDACGNHSAVRTQVITAIDTHAPTIGQAGGNATIDCTATPNFTAPTAADDCSGATVNLLTNTTTGNSCLKVYTRTWDATDACGNHSAVRTQVITAVDTHAPTIGEAGGNATIDCTATPNFTAPTAADDCSGATVNLLTNTTTGNSCLRVFTRTWDATDACGNHSAVRTQVITAIDTHAPTIGQAGGNATIDCTATPNFTAPTAADDCSGATVNLLTNTTTGNSCLRVYTRTWDATDACGNHSAIRTQVITAVDTHAPTIGEAGGNATIDCTATPNFTAPTAADDCSGATVNLLTNTTTGNSCLRVFTRTWDATDACGNHSAVRTQVITAVDTHAPTIGEAGGNATIDCTATPNFTAPTAADDCSGATVNLLTNTTTGNSCLRVFTRTWDATDACGNHSAVRTQVITAVDTHAPTIGQAGGNATIDCTATPNFTAPTAADDCSGATVNLLTNTTTGNSCLRVFTRTWDATDACGNHSAVRTQVITAVDTHAPTIGEAGGNATIDCTATPNFTAPTAADDCSGATVNLLSSTTTGNSCSRVFTRTWDATDACGNHSAVRTQVITAVDTHAPTIGQAGGNATIDCTATPNFTAPTAADDCSGATVNLLTNTTTGNSCLRVFTRTWDATDACGNHSAVRTQVITAVDTHAPTIGEAGGNATIDCTATPNFTAPTAADDCSGATVNLLTNTTTGNSCSRVFTRTWDATDACGNHSAIRTQVITAVDTHAPTIGQAGGNATIDCTATPNFTAPTAADDCSGATVNLLTNTTTGNSCLRVFTRTWDATDACGNHSAVRTQVITAVDTHAPTIGEAGGNATIDCTATPNFTAPTAADDCSGATVNLLTNTTTGNSCLRVFTRTWDATDACGNHSAVRTQVITAVDTHAPTIGQAGGNATIDCTATPNFTAPTATDDCSGATVNLLTNTTTGNSCLRVFTRTWDATDACGNHSAVRTQVITAVDTHAPTIGEAGGNATIDCTATPNFTAPTAADDCSGATVNLLTNTTTGNSCLRVFTRTWDATDACGNHSAVRTQVITAVDTHAPTIGQAGGNATIDCTATPNFTAPTAADDCSGATVNLLTNTTTGNSCLRVFTRTWDATDACGNHSAVRTQVITAVDTHAPTIGEAGGNATIDCTATPNFTAPTAADDCSGATVNLLTNTTTGNSCLRVFTRTWDATDACGNHSAVRTQVITAVDTHAPTIGQAGGNATIDCTATPNFTAPTAADDCSGATVNLLTNTTTGNSCLRVFTRTWDATDACGNHSAVRTQVITAVDTHAPTIGEAGGNATIDCTATPNFTAPTAADDCSGATVNLLTNTTTGNSCLRVYTRTWDATDACGNHSAVRTQVITAVDTHAPTIGQAGGNATIDCTATPNFTAPTAADDCSGATVNLLSSTTTGNSCSRVFTRTWDATDACGNHSAIRTQVITAVDTHAPTIGNAGANATIECTATPIFTAPTAADDCSGATVNLVGSTTTGNSCLRVITRTWDATDACGNHSATRTQSITVADTQPPTIGQAGANVTIECSATPVFTPPTASDACNAFTVNLISDVTAMSSVGIRTETRTWNAVDACGNTSTTRSQTITRLACIYCTYTQGFWGNKNGLAKLPSVLTTPLTIGRTGHSIIIPAGGAGSPSVIKLNSVMPGGSTPTGPLAAGNCSILDACFNTYLSPQGRINNVLISQTITLALNSRLTSGTGILSTLQLGSGCIITSGGSFQINQSVIAYLGGSATVQDLLNLANDVLGGVKTPGVGGVPSYSAINDAVTAINEGFDECRTLYNYCTPAVTQSNAPRPTGAVSKATASTLEVTSYPNPFSDNVRFTIRSTVSGRGTLEVYDMAGAKLQIVYSGYIYSGKGQTIDYKVPALYRTNLMYVLRMGDKIVTGKLINIR